MFTGLVKEVGHVASLASNAEGMEIIIHAPELMASIQIDDSVAVNGVCLTATELYPLEQKFKVQAVHTTLEKTTLKSLRAHSPVNLELALQLSDRLGGHLVQGHVNATTTVHSIQVQGESTIVSFNLPGDLARYFIPEGSVAINGVSLTVAALSETNFSVALIPHTLKNTILGDLNVGDTVNIEVDVLAKYVERLMTFTRPKQSLFEMVESSFSGSAQ